MHNKILKSHLKLHPMWSNFISDFFMNLFSLKMHTGWKSLPLRNYANITLKILALSAELVVSTIYMVLLVHGKVKQCKIPSFFQSMPFDHVLMLWLFIDLCMNTPLLFCCYRWAWKSSSCILPKGSDFCRSIWDVGWWKTNEILHIHWRMCRRCFEVMF